MRPSRPTTILLALVLGIALLPAAALAEGGPPGDATEIVLPGAGSAEGIATGRGSTFYAGELDTGDIYRGDLRTGTAEVFVDIPADDRFAIGLAVDVPNGLLLAAGGPSGNLFVYGLDSGAPLATVPIGAGFVNDVTVTAEGAWVTNSRQAVLTFVPTTEGAVGDPVALPLSGPAANTGFGFNLNGIAATPDGGTLVVAHSGLGEVLTVDPDTGASAEIVLDEVVDPSGQLVGADGILLEAGRLFIVENRANRVTAYDPAPDLSTATLEEVYTNEAFTVPTTVARWGSRLAVVNAQFGVTGDDVFEAVVFRR